MNRSESDGFDLDAEVPLPWESDDSDNLDAEQGSVANSRTRVHNLDPFGDAAFPNRLSRRALW